jgi:hypothetical protein
MKRSFFVVVSVLFALSVMAIGSTVLTVSGMIALRDSDGVCNFTLDELKTLTSTTYEVADPWLGNRTYHGVRLSELLNYVGVPANAKDVVLVCSDGKEFTVSYQHVLEYPIMLTYGTVSGESIRALPASQGGPVKLVYPIDDYPEVLEIYPAENWAWFVIGVRVEM